MRDFGLICVIAAGCGLGVALLGLLGLRAVRQRPLAVALAALSIVTIATMAAGTVGVAQAMLLSSHDLTVVMVVCAVSAVLAVGVAVLLGRPVVADVRDLRRTARELGDGGTVPSGGPGSGGGVDSGGGPTSAASVPRRISTVAELAELGRELDRAGVQLAESRERERAVEHARRELIAWISHDLRTPLAGLRAMAEALEDGLPTDPARYHRRIRTEVDRLSAMVDDLFALSRIQAGALKLTLARMSLYDLVADAMAGTEELARSCSVRVAGEGMVAVPVRVDGREMSRALTNLLVNAIRHTPSDGTVAVSVSEAAGRVVVSVTDACGGIPEEDLPRVFDTGWRGTHARTPSPGGGAGLGLAIVRGIVEAHSGHVAVANIGGGCRFEVHLPLLGAAGP
ncbi:two-component sensor histidine kinase [Streptomyces sp. SID3343]|nr:two-component sensor histidine kinase [Streptomyces sp. SID3343]